MAVAPMNTEQARFNMIEQQIRPWEVLDPVVLHLLSVVKREDFVPAAYTDLAFADVEIPLGTGKEAGQDSAGAEDGSAHAAGTGDPEYRYRTRDRYR